MMKRKFLAVVLPIVGCATLVGSGFSAWVFSDAVHGGNGSVPLNVDLTETIGTTLSIVVNQSSSVKSGHHVILDQGGADTKDVNYNQKGIMFNQKVVQDVTSNPDTNLVVTATYDNDDLALARLDDNGLKLVATIKVSLSETLAKYIQVKNGTNFTVQNGGGTLIDQKTTLTGPVKDENNYNVYTYTYTPNLSAYESDTSDCDETWNFTLNMSTDSNLVNAYLEYLPRKVEQKKYAGGKPTTTADYNAMKGAFQSAQEGGHFKIDLFFEMVPVTTGA